MQQSTIASYESSQNVSSSRNEPPNNFNYLQNKGRIVEINLHKVVASLKFVLFVLLGPGQFNIKGCLFTLSVLFEIALVEC